jgi:hypothetical protein
MVGGVMNLQPLVSLGALIAATLVAGCSSSQMSRIDRNRDLYESWPIDIRQAVLDGKVEPGMTPDMVRVAWGEPSEIVAQSHAGDEIWVYVRGGSDGSVIYPGGGGYPSTYPSRSGSSISIGSGGRGGPVVGVGSGVGIGGTGSIMGPSGSPIIVPPTPPDIREVMFRNGVVHRADAP